MLIDFHVHVSRSEHERPWVLEFLDSQFDGDLWAVVDRVLTPTAIRPFLQEHGIDWAVGLAEDSPATVGSTPHDYVANLCAQANALPDPPTGPRGRVIPFASLNPFTVNDLAA
ncbi:MAG: hypothetical protein AABZ58_12425, partial [Chloroflexota bacterium]